MPSKTQIFKAEQLKAAAAIDKNVYEGDIEVSAKWVQDEHVERVLGTPLFNKIIRLVEDDTMDASENEAYKFLTENYLLYIVAWGIRADVQPQLHNKIRNAGTVRSTDEHVDAVDQDDMYKNIGRYEKKRNAYITKTAEYIRCHADQYPEFSPCGGECGGMRPEKQTEWPCGIYVD